MVFHEQCPLPDVKTRDGHLLRLPSFFHLVSSRPHDTIPKNLRRELRVSQAHTISSHPFLHLTFGTKAQYDIRGSPSKAPL